MRSPLRRLLEEVFRNIVTDNEQTAKQMIEFLKKNRFGRATFLPLNSINTRSGFTQRDAPQEPGVIGLKPVNW